MVSLQTSKGTFTMNLLLPRSANSSFCLFGAKKLGQLVFAVSLTLVAALTTISNESAWANPGERLFIDQGLPSEMEAKIFRQRVPAKNIFRERFVRVNLNLLKEPDALKGKALNTKIPFTGAVKLNLFGDTEYNVVLNSAQRTDSGTRFTGYIEGQPDSEVMLFAGVGSDHGMLGTILTGSGPVHDKNHFLNGADSYRIICSQDSSCTVVQEKPTPLGRDEVIEEGPKPSVPNGFSPQAVLTIPDSGAVIDVLVLYTFSAASNAGGLESLLRQINNAGAITNQVYANSGIPLTLNIVDKRAINDQANIDETTGVGAPIFTNSSSALNYIKTDPAIAKLRDDYSADLVSLVLSDNLFSNSVVGIALTPGSIPNRTTTSDTAFSVVSQETIDTTGVYVFAHELGHNMAARHEIGGSGTTSSPYQYNFAHVESGLGVATVMYSGSNSAYPTVTTRIPYFSNPAIKVQNATIGKTYVNNGPNSPQGEDNHKVLDDNRVEVANYRAKKNELNDCTSPPPVGAAPSIPNSKYPWQFSAINLPK
jgi:Metallo-peptidase family M12